MLLNYYFIMIGVFAGLILFFKLPKLGHLQRKSIIPLQAKDQLAAQDNSRLPELKLSVIIPARNEAENLPSLLSDLRRQSAEIHEIICVDDNSEDATAQIIEEFQVRCVKLSGLPAGWKGKTWACQNGARAATGHLLVFLDADIRLSPTAIEKLVLEFQRKGRPVSVQPYHEVKKPHEYFSLFFNLIEIGATGMSVLGTSQSFGLYGPVFLVEKKTFDQFHGFEMVKDNVAEDLNLGRYYHQQGIDVDLLMGGDQITFRMYPRSFKDLWEGWVKNFSCGAISIRWWILSLFFIWITALNISIVRNPLLSRKV